MKHQLQSLIDIGIKELTVTNDEAVAVNPYEKYIQAQQGRKDTENNTAYYYVDTVNPKWDLFNNLSLPPLPCPSVPNGTYEIDRFEERHQFEHLLSETTTPYLVLVLSEPVAENEKPKLSGYEDQIEKCNEVLALCDRKIKELEVAEKPEGERGGLLGYIKYDFENQTETFTPVPPEAEPVVSAEGRTAADMYSKYFQGAYIDGPKSLTKNNIVKLMEEFASIRVAQEKAELIETYPLAFLEWYSGMGKDKIVRAYKKWQNETKNS